MAEMKVVKILKLSQFDKVFDRKDLTNEIKEYLGERNIDITPCAKMINQRVALTFAFTYIKAETRINIKNSDLEHCGNCDSIDSTFLKMLYRDYFRLYWMKQIKDLRRASGFNEEEYFSIESIDKDYYNEKEEYENDDELREWWFDNKVMKKHEEFINTKFYYIHFEMDNITYKLYKYLTTKLYTRDIDIKLNDDCNYKQDCIIFNGIEGYRMSYYYDYEIKELSPFTIN